MENFAERILDGGGAATHTQRAIPGSDLFRVRSPWQLDRHLAASYLACRMRRCAGCRHDYSLVILVLLVDN
jgi:hypothetical protein